MKDVDSIPDDIWISIFENVSEPWQLAQLVKTCRRFRVLAIKPLLRDLEWTKDSSALSNVSSWNTMYSDLTSLPKMLTVELSYNLKQNSSAFDMRTFDFQTYEKIHCQIPSFTMLEELVFKDTTFSPLAYSVVKSLPSLRRLSISDCLFVPLENYVDSLPTLNAIQLPELDFAAVPITHLTIKHNRLPPDLTLNDYTSVHPLHLITARSLKSLAIVWTTTTSFVYNTYKWRLLSLEELDILISTLSRDLIDSLIVFVKNCLAIPRLKLKVVRHNMPDSQMNGVHFPLRGVNTLEGPLSIVTMLSGDNDMEHVIVNEAMDLTPLLTGLERLSTNLRTLDIQIRKWDVEILFAIRQLFRHLQTLSIRFGRGVLPENFMVTLGSDILPDLQALRNIRIILDSSCAIRPNANAQVLGHHQHILLNPPSDDEEIAPEPTVMEYLPSGFEYNDLKDYLVGWNRYCPNLRNVQLTPYATWQRRFQGDDWVENSLI